MTKKHSLVQINQMGKFQLIFNEKKSFKIEKLLFHWSKICETTIVRTTLLEAFVRHQKHNEVP